MESNYTRTESNFTHAEWTIQSLPDKNLIRAGEKGFVIAEVTKKGVTHFIGNEDEADANARLIHAAPALLKAAEWVLEDAMERGEAKDLLTDQFFDDFQALADAIKKAKGVDND